ncbi:copper chaperone [Anderseniella sp. Alg231-50]|uniref:copper chaperone n=1 Tax=Anderseniella sp. Alg231-50 TaxID=1922226 RepID=UPI003FCE64C3
MSPSALLLNWMLMLGVMMPILIIAPVRYVWRASAPHRRFIHALLFVLGYGAMWVATAPLFLALALAIRAAFQMDYPVLMALVIALLWSASPLQRRTLNAAHRAPRLALTGLRGARDCFSFGVCHSVLCVTTCWAWMLVPMMVAPGTPHIVTMVLVGAVLVTERVAPTAPALWRAPEVLAVSPWLRSFSILRFGVRYG